MSEIRDPDKAWQYLAPVPHIHTLIESERMNEMEHSNLPQSPTLGQLAQSVADTRDFHGLLDDVNLKGRTGSGMSSAPIMMMPKLIEDWGAQSPHGEVTIIDHVEEYRGAAARMKERNKGE